jgi:hypothetical protein
MALKVFMVVFERVVGVDMGGGEVWSRAVKRLAFLGI